MKKNLFYSALLLALGTLVGWVASKTLLPLPWMLGPLLACAIWSINFGEKIAPSNYVFPQKFRNYFVAIIGVMIGSQVTPDLMNQFTKYFPTIFGLLIFSWCAHFMNYKIFIKFGKYKLENIHDINQFMDSDNNKLNEDYEIDGKILKLDDIKNLNEKKWPHVTLGHIHKGGHYVYFNSGFENSSFLTTHNFQTQFGRQVVFDNEVNISKEFKLQMEKSKI